MHTHSTLCLCTCMKHPQTAVPGAADNTVVLYFLQALWSHRIMQSLPHDKDAQPWGSSADLLFPRQNKCHTSLTLQMPHEEYEPGSKQLVTQLKKLHLTTALSPANNQEHVPNLQKSVARCTLMQANMRLQQRHTDHEAFCCQWEKLDWLSLFPLCLWLWDIFLCPSFMSSSAALRSTRDKDRRMKTRS